MSYQNELNAKLNATRVDQKESGKRVDVSSADSLIMQELHDELDLSQYDLAESDLVRAIKLESLLAQYNDIFKLPYALKTFYVIAKATSLNINSIFSLINIKKDPFLNIIKEMRYYELIETNAHNEVELTQKGRAFAKEIGIDIFI